VKYFFIGNQKVVLFSTFRENGWETVASVLRIHKKKKNLYYLFLCLMIFLVGFIWIFDFFFFFKTGVSMR
jgi:hypothetical protein